MPDSRYFELLDHVGLEPEFVNERDPKTGELKPHPNAGQPGPIVQVGIDVATPSIDKKTGDLVTQVKHLVLKPVEAGGRVLSTDNPAAATALLESGQYREVDPPKSKQTRTAREEA
jgi:hypothetical protein